MNLTRGDQDFVHWAWYDVDLGERLHNQPYRSQKPIREDLLMVWRNGRVDTLSLGVEIQHDWWEKKFKYVEACYKQYQHASGKIFF
jgi:hypothetical protein